MKRMKLHLLWLTFLVGIPFFCHSQSWIQKQKIVASDRASGDIFGSSAAISGNYGIVGATYESEDTSGFNTLGFAGSAYIFEKTPSGNWIQKQKLVPSDRTFNDFFGAAVAIEGTIAVVGAYEKDGINPAVYPHAGAVYVFERDTNGIWIEADKLVATDTGAHDHFGFSVSVSENYILVGSPVDDEDELNMNFMNSAGSAYIFKKDSAGNWSQFQKIVSSDREAVDLFGSAVAIQGNYAAVGAYREDHDTAGNDSISDAGSVYIFERDTISGIWIETQKLIAPVRKETDRFGVSVDISENTLVAGAYLEDENPNDTLTLDDAGAAYIFERDTNGIWTFVQKITANDRAVYDNFGLLVTVDNDLILVSSPQEDHDENGMNMLANAGSVYLFAKDSAGTWIQRQKLVPADRAAIDIFSSAIALSGTTLLVGANAEDEDETGNNTLSAAGSAYIFNFCSPEQSTIYPVACNSYLSPSGNYTYTTTGIYLDTLTNISGCDSIITIDLTIGENFSSLIESSCFYYISPSGNHTWNSNGIYYDTLTNSYGCDSILIIDLTVQTIEDSVSQNGAILTAANSSATYQWVDCANGFTVIPGENNQSFTATNNGEYAVILSESGCTDTSNCVTISSINMYELFTKNEILVYPNPNDGNFIISLPADILPVEIVIKDISGKILISEYRKEPVSDFSLAIARGIYTIEIYSEKKFFGKNRFVNTGF